MIPVKDNHKRTVKASVFACPFYIIGYDILVTCKFWTRLKQSFFVWLFWVLERTSGNMVGIYSSCTFFILVTTFLMMWSKRQKIAPKWPFLATATSECQHLFSGFKYQDRNLYMDGNLVDQRASLRKSLGNLTSGCLM